MTRSDYELIGDTIRSMWPRQQRPDLDNRLEIAQHFAEAFEKDSPKFNRFKFIEHTMGEKP